MAAGPGRPESLADEVALFVRASGLERAQVQELREFARQRRQPLEEVMIQRGGVAEAKLLAGLARELGLEYLDAVATPDPGVLKLVPAPIALRQRVLPVGEREGRLRLATAAPFDWQGWDEVEHLLGRPLQKVLAPATVIARALKAGYGVGAGAVEQMVADRGGAVGSQVRGGNQVDDAAADEPTVVNFVNKVLAEGIAARASDIHFEPFDDRVRVRYRVDGLLEDVPVPAGLEVLKHAIVSRVKIMARLDITEKRLPQDGRAQVTFGGRRYDVRVSILPGVFGEAVNIRMQHRQVSELSLEGLGFLSAERERVEALIERPHGLILVTGPTGSGKTTTLYACLQRINRPDTKIITVEDPVEYWMENVVQIQVDDGIGRTFSRALRSILRHDPDVILIGEIRDGETAEIAIRASLTGHLVFATLHTNDAASAVSRLIDLGVKPFLAAGSVIGIVAQRLLRHICPACRQPISGALLGEEISGYEGRGCEACRFSGSRGRGVVAEVLPVTQRIRELIRGSAAADDIKAAAVEEGMTTLREGGVAAVRAGLVAPAEVVRMTEADD
jgi:type II secretory ATPase GspE/PulE/Tfp pilus assembly ATPase PilB-like protein